MSTCRVLHRLYYCNSRNKIAHTGYFWAYYLEKFPNSEIDKVIMGKKAFLLMSFWQKRVCQMALCSSLLWGEGRVPFKSFLRVQIKQVSMYMPAVHKLNAIDVIIKSDDMFIMRSIPKFSENSIAAITNAEDLYDTLCAWCGNVFFWHLHSNYITVPFYQTCLTKVPICYILHWTLKYVKLYRVGNLLFILFINNDTTLMII